MKSLLLCCSLLACLAHTLGYPISWWTDGSPYASHDRLTRRVPTYGDRDCYPFVTVEDEFDPYLSQSLTVDRPARETDAYQRMLADDVVLYASMVPNRMYQWGIQEAPAGPGQYFYAPAERFAYASQDDFPQERVLLMEPKYYESMMPSTFSSSVVNEQRGNKADMREAPQDKMEEKETPQKKEEQFPRKQKQFKRQPMDDPTEHADQ
ncbi:uncharacterized protein [Anabrus simplex]|uniref:uncharacterized protein n=1 Tax=Anabrus simplex TaxID=316456 RepID=UPI0035A37276